MPGCMVRNDGPVTHLTLDFPPGNRIDDETMNDLPSMLARLTSARVLVIRGEGGTFCGGRQPGSYLTAADYRGSVQSIFRANRALRRFPGVTIAAVEGEALGFGAGLAIQCDMVISAADARFGFPEIRHGGAPGIIMSYLPNLIGPRLAFELLVDGREFTAEEALACGLINRVITGDLDAAVAETVSRLLSVGDAPATLKRCRETMFPKSEERESLVTEHMVMRRFPQETQA